MKTLRLVSLVLIGLALVSNLAFAAEGDAQAMALLTELRASGGAGIDAKAYLLGTIIPKAGPLTTPQKTELYGMLFNADRTHTLAWDSPAHYVEHLIQGAALLSELRKVVADPDNTMGLTGLQILAAVTGKVFPDNGVLDKTNQAQIDSFFGLMFNADNTHTDAATDPVKFCATQFHAYDLMSELFTADAATKTAFANLFGTSIVDPAYSSPGYVQKLFDISGGTYYTTPAAFITAMNKADALDRALQAASAEAKANFLAIYGAAVTSPASANSAYVGKLFGIDYTTTAAFITSLENASGTGTLSQVLGLDPDAKIAFENLYNQAVDGSAAYLAIVGGIEIDPANGIVDLATATAFAEKMKSVYALHLALDGDTAAEALFAAFYGLTVVNPAGFDPDYVEKLYAIALASEYVDAAAYLADLKAAGALHAKLAESPETEPGTKAAFESTYGILVPGAAPYSSTYVTALFTIVTGDTYSLSTFGAALIKVNALDAYLRSTAPDRGAERTAFFTLFGDAVVAPGAAGRADYVGRLFGIVLDSSYASPDTFSNTMLAVYNLDVALRADATIPGGALAKFASVYGVTITANTYDSPDYVAALFGIIGAPGYAGPATYITNLKNASTLDAVIALDGIAQAAFTNLYVPYAVYGGAAPADLVYTAKINDLVGTYSLDTDAEIGTFISEMKKAHNLDQALRADAAAKTAFLRLYDITVPAAGGDYASTVLGYVAKLYGIISYSGYTAPADYILILKAAYGLDTALQAAALAYKDAFVKLYGMSVSDPALPANAAYQEKLFSIVNGPSYATMTPAEFLETVKKASDLDAALRADAAAMTVFQTLYSVTAPALPANTYTDSAYVSALFGAEYADLAAYINFLKATNALDGVLQLDPLAQLAFTDIYGVVFNGAGYQDKVVEVAASNGFTTDLAPINSYVTNLKNAYILDQTLRGDVPAKTAFLRLYGITVPVAPAYASTVSGYAAELFGIVTYSFYPGAATQLNNLKAAYFLDQALVNPSDQAAFLNMYNVPSLNPLDPVPAGQVGYAETLFGIVTYYVSATDRYIDPAAYLAQLRAAQALHDELHKAGNEDVLLIFRNAYLGGGLAPATAHDNTVYVRALFAINLTGSAADFVLALRNSDDFDSALALDVAAQEAFIRMYGVKPAEVYTDTNADGVWNAGEPLLTDWDSDGVWDDADAGYAAVRNGIVAGSYPVATTAQRLAFFENLKKADTLNTLVQGDASARSAFQAIYGITVPMPVTSESKTAGTPTYGYTAKLFGIVVDTSYPGAVTMIANLKKAGALNTLLQAATADGIAARAAFLQLYGYSVPANPSDPAAPKYVPQLFSAVTNFYYTTPEAYITALRAAKTLDDALHADPALAAKFLVMEGAAVPAVPYSYDDAAYKTYLTKLFDITGSGFYTTAGTYIANMEKAYALNAAIQASPDAKAAYLALYGITVPASPTGSVAYLAQLYGVVTYDRSSPSDPLNKYIDPAAYLAGLDKAMDLDAALQASAAARAQFLLLEGAAVPATPYVYDSLAYRTYLAKLFSVVCGTYYTSDAAYLTNLDKVYIYHQALINSTGSEKAAFEYVYGIKPDSTPAGNGAYLNILYGIVTNGYYRYKVTSLEEDDNSNGILDAGEDHNGNGILDHFAEDYNGLTLAEAAANQLSFVMRVADFDQALNGYRYTFADWYVWMSGYPVPGAGDSAVIAPEDQVMSNPLYVQKLFSLLGGGEDEESVLLWLKFYNKYWSAGYNIPETDLTYIMNSQVVSADAANGAINSLHPAGTGTSGTHTHALANATEVVPADMSIAVQALIAAYGNTAIFDDDKAAYLAAAQRAVTYLISVQAADGSWYDRYSGAAKAVDSRSSIQTAAAMIALGKVGFDEAKYSAMKKAAQFLISCQNPTYGLINGGKDASGNPVTTMSASDNSYAYQALKAAEFWAMAHGDAVFAAQCRAVAADIVTGINTYLYNAVTGVWYEAINSSGTVVDPNSNGYDWSSFAPALLDVPVLGVADAKVGTWIHDTFQLANGSVRSCTSGAGSTQLSPGFAFEAMLVWLDLGQYSYAYQAMNWAQGKGVLASVDGDTMPDIVERVVNGNLAGTVSTADLDGDTVYDALEVAMYGSAAAHNMSAGGYAADTDSDGLWDIFEILVNGNLAGTALKTDRDNDSVMDAAEYTMYGSASHVNMAANGYNTDHDVDGIPDIVEWVCNQSLSYAVSAVDSDGDGVRDAVENAIYGDLHVDMTAGGIYTDHDGDGVADILEVVINGNLYSASLSTDKDIDGVPDAIEMAVYDGTSYTALTVVSSLYGSGLWQNGLNSSSAGAQQSQYGWVDWMDSVTGLRAADSQRYIDTSAYAALAMMGGYDFSAAATGAAFNYDFQYDADGNLVKITEYYPGTATRKTVYDFLGGYLSKKSEYNSSGVLQKVTNTGIAAGLSAAEKTALYNAARPYIKYFLDRAETNAASGFKGFTASFQLGQGGMTDAEQGIVDHAAFAYDQTILGLLRLYAGDTTILDTYVAYTKDVVLNDSPLIYPEGDVFIEGAGGPYKMIRISGFDEVNWKDTWDYNLDTGAAACLISYAVEAYNLFGNEDYKDFASLLGDYILRLQDNDGGIRYGPHGMGTSWNTKSTEQNERAARALEDLFIITNDSKYLAAAMNIEGWLSGMYSTAAHLFYTGATWNGSTWIKNATLIASDVMAFAPLDLMFTDTAFGADQSARNAEIDAMFEAIESATAFEDVSGNPLFFKFTAVGQTNQTYGSVEWSSQMALAYLDAAHYYYDQGNTAKYQAYLGKYNTLMTSLAGFFSAPAGDALSLVAPYASVFATHGIAVGATGTGYNTLNAQGSLASAYYAIALTEGMKPWMYEYYADGTLLSVTLMNGTKTIYGNDIFADFGTNGFYKYSNNAWTRISTMNTDSFMISERYSGSYDVISDFGTNGFYKYSGSTWTKLSTMNADSFALSDQRTNGTYDIVTDFGTNGFYRYADNSWTKLSGLNADSFMLTSLYNGNYDIISDFNTSGLYRYSGSTWTKISTLNADSFMLSDRRTDGTYDIISDFNTSGFYRYSGSTWTKLSSLNADSFMLTELYNGNYDIIGDFNTSGLYRYSGSTWTKLSGLNADSFMLSDRRTDGAYDVIADFNTNGFYRYSSGSWTKLSGFNADSFMLTELYNGNYDVLADFGTNGLYKYSSNTWTKLSGMNAESFILTERDSSGAYDIMADFGTNGFYKYSNNTWTKLSGLNADSELSQILDINGQVRRYGKDAQGGFTSTSEMAGTPTRPLP